MVANRHVVVGPVGFERHILLDADPWIASSGRTLALEVEASWISLGGSGFFACRALSATGEDTRLITNTGDSSLLRDTLAQQLPHVSLEDARLGKAGEYTSVWTRSDNSRRLLLSSAADPSLAKIEALNVYSDDRLIALSLREPETYLAVSAVASKANCPYFIAPNQTLFNHPQCMSQLAEVATAIFLNRAEAEALSGASRIDQVVRWYLALRPAATLVVTADKDSTLVVWPDGRSDSVPATAARVKSPIGGGDIFASLAAARWDGTTRALSGAAKVTAALLTAQQSHR